MLPIKPVVMSNGVSMPPAVMSTRRMNYREMKAAVMAGLKAGFRAFDTARDYGPEEPIVGRVMKECLCELGLKREDIFLTTKIGNGQQIEANISEQIDISLRHLQTDYVDLWLMHWPLPGYYLETWKKMEEVYKSGKVRSIGLANPRVRHLKAFYDARPKVPLHCVHFEMHPFRTCQDIVSFCRERSIAIQSYAPFCYMIPKVREDPVLNQIAGETGHTLGQVVLRWHYQHNYVPVFGTRKPDRAKENFGMFGFELNQGQMERIDALNQDYKFHLESVHCPGF